MANLDHYAILTQGVDTWNQWRQQTPQTDPDLRQAQLSDRLLQGINLRNADLSQADLHGANLTGADLRNAKLMQANLLGADLVQIRARWAKFNRADLSHADLSRADLFGADFYKADLTHACLASADLHEVNIVEANLDDANLNGANLRYARIVRSRLRQADLSNAFVFGISAWEVDLTDSRQTNLVITPPNAPIVTTDNLEVAQFIYLILNNAKIRDVIDTVARKAVLILGRFTPERKKILDAIRTELRKRNYLPILFDFDKPTARDISETVRTLAHLSRFIVADLTDPKSIPLELQTIVPDLAVPIQPLLLQGQAEFSMFVDLRKKYHWVLTPQTYQDETDLLAMFDSKVIANPEAKAIELENR